MFSNRIFASKNGHGVLDSGKRRLSSSDLSFALVQRVVQNRSEQCKHVIDEAALDVITSETLWIIRTMIATALGVRRRSKRHKLVPSDVAFAARQCHSFDSESTESVVPVLGREPAILAHQTVQNGMIVVSRRTLPPKVGYSGKEIRPMTIRKRVQFKLPKRETKFLRKISNSLSEGRFRQLKLVLLDHSSLTRYPMLTPHLTRLVYNTARRRKSSERHLSTVLLLAEHILNEPCIQIEPYAHQLLSALFTIALSKEILCSNVKYNHCLLKKKSSELIQTLVKRFSETYVMLLPTISNVLSHILKGPAKCPQSICGAISILRQLGGLWIEKYLWPELPALLTYICSEKSPGFNSDIAWLEKSHLRQVVKRVLAESSTSSSEVVKALELLSSVEHR